LTYTASSIIIKTQTSFKAFTPERKEAMTNNQIIFMKSQELAKEGIIQYTGRVFNAKTADGQTVEVKETEAIHTFMDWKKAGFMVKKGSKAVAKFTIWNFTSKATKAVREAMEKEGKEAPENPHYYMKEAAFFSASQVQPIEA